MKIKDAFYLPSGRVFTVELDDGYVVECTEMRDVAVDGKQHLEVRSSNDPHVIWKHLVPYQEKWLLTISTQRGCVHNCQFCDVAPLPYKGNLSYEEMYQQVSILIESTPHVSNCAKAKIGFARMGEPAHNLENVLKTMSQLPNISERRFKNFNWLPCFNSILPEKCATDPRDVVKEVVSFKEFEYNGILHFQISCNSTCEETRTKLFGGSPVLSIEEIIGIVNQLEVTKRTVTLNFIVMQGVEVDVEKLSKMGLNSNKFAVKLIPLNSTIQGEGNGLKTVANYKNYEKLLTLKEEFESAGVPVVVDAIAKCEEAGLCCGQLVQIFQ